MSKVFVVGSGPLPNEKDGIREAAGLRTEKFLSALRHSGHKVFCVVIGKKINLEIQKTQNQSFVFLDRNQADLSKHIKKFLTDFSPDVVVGVNTFPCFMLAKVSPKHIPFWADLNGWCLAEGQAKAYFENSNGVLPHLLTQEKKIVETADKFSTVSTAQKFCTIGELALQKRLFAETFFWNFVESIPNSTAFFETDVVETEEKFFRGTTVPKDAFVVSFIGGYNNWVDEKTLFDALEKAMKQNDKIFFVSTGGAIANVSNKTFSSFLSRIQKSVFKNRFVFLGWIDTVDMPRVYRESDIGVNVDFLCVETCTGARNRINEMMKFGLPVVTTKGSEIAEDIEKFGCGIAVESGKATAFADAILKFSYNKEYANQCGQSGQKVSTEIFEASKLLQKFLAFVENPQKAPDFLQSKNLAFLWCKGVLEYIQKNGMRTSIKKIGQKVRGFL